MQLLHVVFSPTCKVVMATAVVGGMCVENTMVEGTCIMQIQPKVIYCLRQFLLATILIRYKVVQSLISYTLPLSSNK